jgi:hypothetical protein
MGTCYVNIYVAFKAVVMAFSYAWRVVPSIYVDYYEFEGDWFFYYHCEVLCSSWFLKELFELIKLILWHSNNQTYHLDS